MSSESESPNPESPNPESPNPESNESKSSRTIHLRLGTRGSALARWQAEWVQAELSKIDGVEVELILISTQGDQQQQGPIGALGGQGVFTKEIQRALLDHEIDLAVHSLKDLPTEVIEGLTLGAVPKRGPIGDAFVSQSVASFEELPQGASVGTGSLRRQAQLLNKRPDLKMKDIRGNVDTRLKKLADEDYDAIILAEAGLVRLELAEHITQTFPMSIMLPAVGQGALGIEIRKGDHQTHSVVSQLNDAITFAAVTAERAMLATLRGGCLAPVAAWGRVEEQLVLTGAVLAVDGSTRIDVSHSVEVNLADVDQAIQLGQKVAEDLISQGATALIQSARKQ